MAKQPIPPLAIAWSRQWNVQLFEVAGGQDCQEQKQLLRGGTRRTRAATEAGGVLQLVNMTCIPWVFSDTVYSIYLYRLIYVYRYIT